MLGSSAEFGPTIAGGGKAISALRVLNDTDQPVVELTGKTVDALVSADRTAANLRLAQITLAGDDDSQIPETFASVLGPTTRVQILRGMRIQNVVTVGGVLDSPAAWTPTTPLGVLNGVAVLSDGSITIGP